MNDKFAFYQYTELISIRTDICSILFFDKKIQLILDDRIDDLIQNFKFLEISLFMIQKSKRGHETNLSPKFDWNFSPNIETN